MTEYDTVKVSDITVEINDTINDLSKLLDEYYSYFNNMPYKTREWVGVNAEEFVRILNVEKKDYDFLILQLTEANKKFHNYVNNLNGEISELQVRLNDEVKS